MRTCDTCERTLPTEKFNAESFSPGTCFKCRIQGVKLGFGGNREAFHGDTLRGGTIRSDNEHTVKLARENGHDPVPVKTAGGVGVSQKELNRLKSIV
jgi:hypothetical protein